MIPVGYFKEHHNGKYAPFESTSEAIPCKAHVLQYMKRGKVIAAAPGRMRDVFTGEVIRGEMLVYSDGLYFWGTESIYYFEKYNLKLPGAFVEHAMRSMYVDKC